MAELRIIKNSKQVQCEGCGAVHEFVSRPSDHATCDTPLAMPAAQARELAAKVARGREDVIRIPTDTMIVIEDSNRLLPKLPEPDLAHYMSRERLA